MQDIGEDANARIDQNEGSVVCHVSDEEDVAVPSAKATGVEMLSFLGVLSTSSAESSSEKLQERPGCGIPPCMILSLCCPCKWLRRVYMHAVSRRTATCTKHH